MSEHNNACDECGQIVTERNHYFTGKFMMPRDMRADTDYLLSRQRAHNRLLHGWGVLCGLNVVKHGSTDCEENYVIVKPGAALDCCGREIYIQDTQYVRLPNEADEKERVGNKFLLFVRYNEAEIEHVPALYDEHSGKAIRTQPNRLVDAPEFVFKPYESPWTEFWNLSDESDKSDEPRCEDDCGDPQPGPAGVCLDPDCLPRKDPTPMVVLALIRRNPGSAPTIDLRYRRELPVPSRLLTHVVKTNWKHGGEVDIQTLREWNGELRITFDRKLGDPDGMANGVNEFTFLVDYYKPDEDYEIEVLSTDDETDNPIRVETPEAGCSVAVYKMHTRRYLGKLALKGARVRVTLKCDFILDCHGVPVDGNHLCGKVPSGDGVEGGTFESWFTVVDSSDKHDANQESKGR